MTEEERERLKGRIVGTLQALRQQSSYEKASRKMRAIASIRGTERSTLERSETLHQAHAMIVFNCMKATNNLRSFTSFR